MCVGGGGELGGGGRLISNFLYVFWNNLLITPPLTQHKVMDDLKLSSDICVQSSVIFSITAYTVSKEVIWPFGRL